MAARKMVGGIENEKLRDSEAVPAAELKDNTLLI